MFKKTRESNIFDGHSTVQSKNKVTTMSNNCNVERNTNRCKARYVNLYFVYMNVGMSVRLYIEWEVV